MLYEVITLASSSRFYDTTTASGEMNDQRPWKKNFDQNFLFFFFFFFFPQHFGSPARFLVALGGSKPC